MIQSCIGAFSVGWELIKGSWYIRSLQGKKRITFFGGKNVEGTDDAARAAYKLAGIFVERDYSVLSGGGAGIMEAANCGSQDAAKRLGKKGNWTLGIGVFGLDEGYNNKCSFMYRVSKFFARKHLLICDSDAFVIFPGGIGTVDEFFEVLNLMKTNRIKEVPVILFDSRFWKSLVDC